MKRRAQHLFEIGRIGDLLAQVGQRRERVKQSLVIRFH